MFKANYDSMRPGPTPERVLAICRLVAEHSYTSEEILERIYLMQDTSKKAGEEFKGSIEAAVELGFLKVENGQYVCTVPKETFATPQDFRRAAASRAFSLQNSTFFMLSHWYLSSNEKVFFFSNWEDKAVAASKAGLERLTHNDILGWRFWASFLGLGYLSEADLIPNLYVRIKDVLAVQFSSQFEFNVEIPIDRFLPWLLTMIPEARMEDQSLNMALSNGLRTLRDMGEIELIAGMDAIKMSLYPIPEDITSQVSHVIVKEAVTQ